MTRKMPPFSPSASLPAEHLEKELVERARFQPKAIEVRVASSQEELNDIFRFRYQIYVQEMGRYQDYADHKQKMLIDSLDREGSIYYIPYGKQIIASIRLNFSADTHFDEEMSERYQFPVFKEFGGDTIVYVSRLMVRREWRGSPIIGLLLSKIYLAARERGVRFGFCNSAPALIPFYEQLGYRRYTGNFVDPEVGYRVPLVLIVEDYEHLRGIRSVFARVARQYPKDPRAAEWFKAKFPDYANVVSPRTMSEEDFYDLMNRKLYGSTRQRIPLLQGLDEDELRRFYKVASIVEMSRGETIIRPGDVGQEMFVILSGLVEVFGEKAGHRLSLATLGKGQIFGEVSFVSNTPRAAYVVAQTDLTALTLTPGFFEKSIKTMPGVMSKILRNLAAILSERLRTSTMQLKSMVSLHAGVEPPPERERLERDF